MKFFEYHAKEIFRKGGLITPKGIIAKNPQEAEDVFKQINKPVALKAQVQTGGRGKAGGIKFADTPEEAKEVSKELFGMNIKGETVKTLLLEEKMTIDKEFYISITRDRIHKRPIIMGSAEGGMDIELLATEHPEKIIKYYPDPIKGFYPYEAREMARKMGVGSKLIGDVGNAIWKLYNNIYSAYDAQTAEINPLILTPDGLIAADAKLEIEDDALFRHKELKMLEEYDEVHFAFVKLDGDIAVIGNGAGLTLTGMDMIKLYGGKPATFLDIGGGADAKVMREALNQVLDYENVKVVFINILGGITRADEVAKGVISAINDCGHDVPMAIRLTGTNEEEGQRLLEEEGISFETSMEKAAEKAVQLRKALN